LITLIQRINDNIIFIEGSVHDCNSYIIDDIIIDTGTGINDHLLSALKKVDIGKEKQVKFK